MKTYILATIICLLAISCSKNDQKQLKIDPDYEISFDVEWANSTENFSSKAKNVKDVSKLESWSLNNDDEINLGQAINFDVELENGKKLTLYISFGKDGVNKDLLIIEGGTILYHGDRSWDYKSFEKETDFYQSFDSVYFRISETNNYYDVEVTDFSFVSSEKALVNGKEKSFITIDFQLEGFNPEDSTGDSGVYKITNGTFRGVLE